MRKTIAAVAASEIATASQQICTHLSLAEGELDNPTTIAIYAAHRNEVDLTDLHQLLPKKALLYPLCHSASRLTFHQVHDVDSLIPGMHGILEPSPSLHAEIPLDTIDLFLCPGLAFTPDGKRLGQGGGYYDRILSKKQPTARIIGICLARQVLEDLPSEDHDIQMDYLLTEEGLLKTS